MNKIKLSITCSLLLVSVLGSSQTFAKDIKVQIGKIDEGIEIIKPNWEETFDHDYECKQYDQAVFIRVKGSKIQPACVNYGSLDSTIMPLGEEITFITLKVDYKDAILDLDKKKIR